jgi:hypothetical protein
MGNLKKIILIGGVTAAVALTGLTGCQTRSAGDARTQGQIVDDNKITRTVQTELRNEPVYKFNDVDVRTYGRVVQLSGFVATEQQRNRAGELAQQAPGVARVVNSIAIQPDTTLTPTGREGELHQNQEQQRQQEQRQQEQRQQEQRQQEQRQQEQREQEQRQRDLQQP